MAHGLEKLVESLKAELDNLRKQHKFALEMIRKNTATIEDLRNQAYAFQTDKEFLLDQIKVHKKSIQLPTEPDRMLWAAGREVRRNPSK